LSGFKKHAQEVVLEVGQRARLDATLEIGALAETVTIRDPLSQLNSNDATLGAVIPEMQVANLPLAIRNWDDLLALVPGVQQDRYTSRGAARPSAAPAASTCMAPARCRTTSCSTASTTTAFPRTCRS
jgi:hypothetical protein